MATKRNHSSELDAGQSAAEASPIGDRDDDSVAYSAGAVAPPARGRAEADREVEFGAPFVPAARDPVFGAESDALEQTDEMNVPLDAAARTDVRSTSPVGVASPATPIPLRTDDGRVVSVVHIVAELAPFARTGGLGEAVKSLAEFQSASGIPTAIIMPLYRQVHAVAPNLEPVGEPFTVHLGPHQEQARLMQITPD